MKSVLLCAIVLIASATAYADENPADSLSISKNVNLNEIVVSATRVSSKMPIAYSELSRTELTKRNNGQSVPFLLSLTPSVVSTSDDGAGIGYTGFRIRGTDAARINVTMNGVPVNDSESHGVFWVNMPDIVSSVDNIQIQRGAGTSMNGGAAFGATVALQTLAPSIEPYFEYSTSAGSFNTMRNTVRGGTGLLSNHFVFDARYSVINSDGFIDRAKTNMQSYFVSGAYYAGSTLIKLQTFGSAEKTYQAWNGVPSYMLDKNSEHYNRTYNSCGKYYVDGVTKYYDNQTDNYWQRHYHLMASHVLDQHWSMNATLHYTNGEGYYEDYRNNQRLRNYKLPIIEGSVDRTDLIRRKWLDNDFYGIIYNTTYKSEKLDMTFGAAANRYEGYHFGRVMWLKEAPILPDPNYEYYRNKGVKDDYNAFAKATYLFSRLFSGYADIQYRGIDYSIKGSDDKAGDNVDINKNWNFLNPKAGINFHGGGHRAFASFAVANREPTRKNFTEAADYERPTHETLFNYELGYTFAHPTFSLGANLYYMDYENQLILSGKISEIGEALTTNIKDSYRTGIELTAGMQIIKQLTWNGNATFSRNRIKGFTEYVDDWDTGGQIENHIGSTNIALSPDVVANSVFEFSTGAFSAGFNSQYVGRQYLDNTSSKRHSLDAYFVSNLRVGYVFFPRFMKEVSLDVTVNNIFNEKYESNGWVYSYYSGGERGFEDGIFTQAGTNAMARLTFKF